MKFTIFDFDDTLVKTTTKIIVFGRRGTKVLSSIGENNESTS